MLQVPLPYNSVTTTNCTPQISSESDFGSSQSLTFEENFTTALKSMQNVEANDAKITLWASTYLTLLGTTSNNQYYIKIKPHISTDQLTTEFCYIKEYSVFHDTLIKWHLMAIIITHSLFNGTVSTSDCIVLNNG
jgi:hypothetical protein